ncbi:MAG: sugar nucleotide-binding protein, partial [Alphaproteobacteria bacterium]|nr:sugar nucleotide-binding protein [Alphaproteobacteria bacterium]
MSANILVIGRTGQLAAELMRLAPAKVRLQAVGRDQFDLSDLAAIPG